MTSRLRSEWVLTTLNDKATRPSRRPPPSHAESPCREKKTPKPPGRVDKAPRRPAPRLDATAVPTRRRSCWDEPIYLSFQGRQPLGSQPLVMVGGDYRNRPPLGRPDSSRFEDHRAPNGKKAASAPTRDLTWCIAAPRSFRPGRITFFRLSCLTGPRSRSPADTTLTNPACKLQLSRTTGPIRFRAQGPTRST